MPVAALSRLALAGVVATLIACSADVPAPTSQPEPRATGKLFSAGNWQLFGVGVHEGAAVPIEDVVAAPGSFAGKDLRVTGRIQAVCKVNGSWLVLGDDTVDVRVTFKDDAFVVPMDCDGCEAVLEGRLQAKADAATGYSFIAEGVAFRTSSAR